MDYQWQGKCILCHASAHLAHLFVQVLANIGFAGGINNGQCDPMHECGSQQTINSTNPHTQAAISMGPTRELGGEYKFLKQERR